MKGLLFFRICFENSKLDFSSAVNDMTEEETKEDLIGKPFDFRFKNEGIATCIDVVFPEV